MNLNKYELDLLNAKFIALKKLLLDIENHEFGFTFLEMAGYFKRFKEIIKEDDWAIEQAMMGYLQPLSKVRCISNIIKKYKEDTKDYIKSDSPEIKVIDSISRLVIENDLKEIK